jgi:hypothetical protein
MDIEIQHVLNNNNFKSPNRQCGVMWYEGYGRAKKGEKGQGSNM